MTAYKELFTDRQRKQLAANGHLEDESHAGLHDGPRVQCYVSYHEPTRRLTTLPVDSLRPLTHIYGQPLSRQEQEALRGGVRSKLSISSGATDVSFQVFCVPTPTIGVFTSRIRKRPCASASA